MDPVHAHDDVECDDCGWVGVMVPVACLAKVSNNHRSIVLWWLPPERHRQHSPNPSHPPRCSPPNHRESMQRAYQCPLYSQKRLLRILDLKVSFCKSHRGTPLKVCGRGFTSKAEQLFGGRRCSDPGNNSQQPVSVLQQNFSPLYNGGACPRGTWVVACNGAT